MGAIKAKRVWLGFLLLPKLNHCRGSYQGLAQGRNSQIARGKGRPSGYFKLLSKPEGSKRPLF